MLPSCILMFLHALLFSFVLNKGLRFLEVLKMNLCALSINSVFAYFVSFSFAQMILKQYKVSYAVCCIAEFFQSSVGSSEYIQQLVFRGEIMANISCYFSMSVYKVCLPL